MYEDAALSEKMCRNVTEAVEAYL